MTNSRHNFDGKEHSHQHDHGHDHKTSHHGHSHGEPTGNLIEEVGFTRHEFLRMVLAGVATGGLYGCSSGSPTLSATPRSESYEDEVFFHELSPYREFLKKEGIPVYEGGFIDDLSELELKPWKRIGALGAYIFLEGTGGTVDGWVCEIPEGSKTVPERHIFEEQILVLQGKGATQAWQADEKEMVTVEWEKGSMFPTPLNTWHRHLNLGQEPARLIGITNAPLLIDMFRHTDFIFHNDYVFSERFGAQRDYFSPEPQAFFPTEAGKHHSYSIVNFVRNVWECELHPAGQGVDDRDNHFAMARNSMASHVEQFPTGTYQRAHRHGPGSTIILLNGQGYSLMWPPELGTTPFADEKSDHVQTIHWKEGTLVIPPLNWYHQHFNSGGEAARFVKLGGWNNDLYPFTTTLVSDPSRVEIDYPEEDSKVREIFAEELGKTGGRMNMPEGVWKKS